MTKTVIKTIALEGKNEESNSDAGEESDFDENSLCDAYKSMYSHQIQVCEKDRALVSEKIALLDLKNKVEKELQVSKACVAKKRTK